MQNHSIFWFLYLSQKKAESLFSLYSFFAELVIGTESGGMGVESIGAVIENDFHCIDSFSIFVQKIAQIHFYFVDCDIIMILKI